MSPRTVRETRETRVEVELERGTDPGEIQTGRPFLDHMLATLGRYAGLRLNVRARGDLVHHLMEDVAITVGMALRRAIPATAARFGTRTLPMDDALVQAAVDVGGRPR